MKLTCIGDVVAPAHVFEIPFSGSRVSGMLILVAMAASFCCLNGIHTIPAKTKVKQIGSTHALISSGHEYGSAPASLRGRLSNINPFMVVPKRPWMVIAGDTIHRRIKLSYMNTKSQLVLIMSTTRWGKTYLIAIEGWLFLRTAGKIYRETQEVKADDQNEGAVAGGYATPTRGVLRQGVGLVAALDSKYYALGICKVDDDKDPCEDKDNTHDEFIQESNSRYAFRMYIQGYGLKAVG